MKRILRYLRGTSKACLCFGGDKPVLQVYMDADIAGDVDFRKSLSGYIAHLVGGAIS